MKKVLFWTLCAISPAALGSIGIATETFEDRTRNRIIEAKVFYPTAAKANMQTFAENAAFYGFKAIEDAPPTGRNLPLYILVHGTSGNWKNLSWLGSQLAKEGALVISANHPSYTTRQATPENVIRMWDQPKDVSFIIDQTLKNAYSPFVDPTNITVIGYSLGGYTALAMAGAQLDMKGYQDYCKRMSDNSCRYFKDTLDDLTKADLSTMSLSYKDNRVTTAIAIAPGYMPAVTSQSLKELSTKTVIVGAEFDKTIPPQLQITPYLKQKSGYLQYKEVEGASHFSFMQDCKPKAVSILAEEGAAFVCQEAPNVEREAIHQKLVKIIAHSNRI